MNKSTRYSPEVREQAVRLVFEHQGEHASQWAALISIANKIGCTPEGRYANGCVGLRRMGGSGMTTDDRERLKSLERENKELRRANDILRTASAFFAQAELDRRLK